MSRSHQKGCHCYNDKKTKMEVSTQMDDQKLNRSIIEKRSAVRYVVMVPTSVEDATSVHYECICNENSRNKRIDYRNADDTMLTAYTDDGEGVRRFRNTMPTTAVAHQQTISKRVSIIEPKLESKRKSKISNVNRAKSVEKERLKNDKMTATHSSMKANDETPRASGNHKSWYTEEGIKRNEGKRKSKSSRGKESGDLKPKGSYKPSMEKMDEISVYRNTKDEKSETKSRRGLSAGSMQNSIGPNGAYIKVLNPNDLRHPNCNINISGKNYKATFKIGLDPDIDKLIFDTLNRLNECTCGRDPDCVDKDVRSEKAKKIVESCYKVLRTLYETAQVIDETTSKVYIYAGSKTGDGRCLKPELLCSYPLLTNIKECVRNRLREPCNYIRSTISGRNGSFWRKDEKKANRVGSNQDSVVSEAKTSRKAGQMKEQEVQVEPERANQISYFKQSQESVGNVRTSQKNSIDSDVNMRLRSGYIEDGSLKRRSRSIQTSRRSNDGQNKASQIRPSNASLPEVKRSINAKRSDEKLCKCSRAMKEQEMNVNPNRSTKAEQTNMVEQDSGLKHGSRPILATVSRYTTTNAQSDEDEENKAPEITPSDAVLSDPNEVGSLRNQEPVEVQVNNKKITMQRQPYIPTAESLELMNQKSHGISRTPMTNTQFDEFSRRIRIISPYKTIRVQKEQHINGNGVINILLDSGQTISVIDPSATTNWSSANKATQIEPRATSTIPSSKYVAILEPVQSTRQSEVVQRKMQPRISNPNRTEMVQNYFFTTTVEPEFGREIPPAFFNNGIAHQRVNTQYNGMINENFKRPISNGENLIRSETVLVKSSKKVACKQQNKWAKPDTNPGDVLSSNFKTSQVVPWNNNRIIAKQKSENIEQSEGKSTKKIMKTKDMNILKTIRAVSGKTNLQFLKHFNNGQISFETCDKRSAVDQSQSFNIVKSTSKVVYSEITYVDFKKH